MSQIESEKIEEESRPVSITLATDFITHFPFVDLS